MSSVDDRNTSEMSEGTSQTVTNMDNKTQRNKYTTSFCVNHPNQEVRYFCNEHSADCCDMCLLKDHKQCIIVTTDDIYTEFSGFLKQANQTSKIVEQLKLNLKSQFKNIGTSIQVSENKIHFFYNEIRTKVDEAENESLKRLHDLRTSWTSTVSRHFDEYESLKKQISDIIEEGRHVYNEISTEGCETMEPDSEPPSGHGLQTDTKDIKQFIARHESTIELINKQVSDINKWNKKINVNCVNLDESFVDKLVSNLMHSVCLSSLYDVVPPQRVVYKFVKNKQIRCSKGGVYNINMVPNSEDEILVLTRRPNTIQHINGDSKVLRIMDDLPGTPRCFCVYSDLFAVTFDELKLIKSYKLSNFMEYSAIQTSDKCWGICRVENGFSVTFEEEGLVRNINDIGRVINSSGNMFKNPRHVEMSDFNKHILVSDEGNNRVVVLSEDLQRTMFIIKHPDLKLPRGLCTDTNGSIYICDGGAHSILRFTNDGKYDSTVFTRIGDCYGICFNKSKTILAVDVCKYQEDKIYLYKVQHEEDTLK